MPSAVESKSIMKPIKSSKKRKADADSEQTPVVATAESATNAEEGNSDAEKTAARLAKEEKKRAKKTKKEAKESAKSAASADLPDTPVESSEEVVKSKKRSKKEKSQDTAAQPEQAADPMQIDSNEDVAAPEPANGPDDETSAQPPSKKRKTSVEEIEVDVNAPEPPSKKALRRLKKGKPLPPSKSGADSSPEPEEKTPAAKRSEYGVWIGNMAWSTSKDELTKFLVENSDLTDDMITRVHMPGPNDSKSANKVQAPKFGKVQHNKGYAYVDFSTEEGVNMAIELSEQLLTGRRLLIKNSKSFEGRPKKEEAPVDYHGKPPSRKIWVGNMRYDATQDSIKEHFERCGPIEKVFVATFEDSGKCKGYGWVTFEAVESAQAAVRGWVEEAVSDDSASEDSDSESEDEDVSKKAPKKQKKKRVWVNRIAGRPLNMEFAEDDETRYKKRFKSKAGGEDGGSTERPPREERPAKKHEYRTEYAPRLTGGIVESKGKKITF